MISRLNQRRRTGRPSRNGGRRPDNAGGGGGGGSITRVGSTYNRSSTATLPAETAEDDVGLIIVCLSGLNGTPDITLSDVGPGWTKLLEENNAYRYMSAWIGTFGATPTAPTIGTWSQAGSAVNVLTVLRGVTSTTPIDSGSVGGATTPALDATAAGQFVLAAAFQRDDDTTINNVQGYTTRHLENNGGGADTGIWVGDQIASGAETIAGAVINHADFAHTLGVILE